MIRIFPKDSAPQNVINAIIEYVGVREFKNLSIAINHLETELGFDGYEVSECVFVRV